MPELPEVENTVRDLKPLLVGRRVEGLEIFWTHILDDLTPDLFRARLLGRQIINVDRRGKYLLFPLDDRQTLILHLRMTGQLHLYNPEQARDKHTHLIMALDNGQRLHYRDLRKFGRFYLVDDPQTVLGKLGPEPLSPDFTPIDLFNAIQGRQTAIKPLLLDQRIVAGIGNIYADESLFLAHLDPRRPGNTLNLADCSRLHASIRSVLAQAIREGGSTLGDSDLSHYHRPTGVSGRYQRRHNVYGRAGQPCPVCGAPISRIKLGQRSTHFCPTCQRNDLLLSPSA